MKKIIQIVLVVNLIISLFACEQKHINEWVEKDGNTYYYDATGQIVRNCKKLVNGSWYAFDENGHLVISKVVNYDGKSYIANGIGLLEKNGWYKCNGNWYYLKGYLLQSGWIEDKGDWYYLNSSTYELCKNQWVDNTYYVGNDGKMLVNMQKEINGEICLFNSSGIATKLTTKIVDGTRSLIVNCILPKTFTCSAGEVIIERITGKIESDFAGDYKFDTYWSGTDGLHSRYYSSTSVSKQVGWKLYDPDGYLISTGTFYTESLFYGDKFRDEPQTIGAGKINRVGTYILELMDVR